MQQRFLLGVGLVGLAYFLYKRRSSPGWVPFGGLFNGIGAANSVQPGEFVLKGGITN